MSVTVIALVVPAVPTFVIPITKFSLKPTPRFPLWELAIERSGNGGMTLKDRLPLVARFVVTFTLRAPRAALEAIVNVAVAWTSERTLTLLTVIAVPASIVRGRVKLVPSSVALNVAPCPAKVGERPVRVGIVNEKTTLRIR